MKYKNLNEYTLEQLYKKRRIDHFVYLLSITFGMVHIFFGLYLYLIAGLTGISIFVFILGISLFFTSDFNYILDLLIYLKEQNREMESLPLIKPVEILLPVDNKKKEDKSVEISKKDEIDKKVDELYAKVTRGL